MLEKRSVRKGWLKESAIGRQDTTGQMVSSIAEIDLRGSCLYKERQTQLISSACSHLLQMFNAKRTYPLKTEQKTSPLRCFFCQSMEMLFYQPLLFFFISSHSRAGIRAKFGGQQRGQTDK